MRIKYDSQDQVTDCHVIHRIKVNFWQHWNTYKYNWIPFPAWWFTWLSCNWRHTRPIHSLFSLARSFFLSFFRAKITRETLSTSSQLSYSHQIAIEDECVCVCSSSEKKVTQAPHTARDTSDKSDRQQAHLERGREKGPGEGNWLHFNCDEG